MRAALFIFAGLCALSAHAAPLDDALALVLAESAVLAEKQAEASAIAKQSEWVSKARFGYNRLATSTDGSGLNAGVTVEIPLFSRKREIAAAKARHAVAKVREKLASTFLGEVADLSELETKRAEAAEMSRFYRDRLEYFKQAVSEGRIESDLLWADAEKAKKAEHKARQGQIKLDAALEESARRYGGHEWKRLQALLAAHVKQSKP